MLRLNCARFNGVICCGRQDTPQRQQGSATHVGQTVLFHRAANAGIEHPLRNLQCRSAAQFDLHATENYFAAASRLGLNENALPIPPVPTVLYFSSAGLMGVLYPTCTTITVRTPRSATDRQHRDVATRSENRVWRSGKQSTFPLPHTLDGDEILTKLVALH